MPGLAEFRRRDPTEALEAAQAAVRLTGRGARRGSFRWGTAFCHWGDVFAAMSFARARFGIDGGGMLYCGPDRTIPEFLAAQSWVREVVGVFDPAYRETYRAACALGSTPADWLPLLAAKAGDVRLPPAVDVDATHYVHLRTEEHPVLPFAPPHLPEARMAAAGRIADQHRPKAGALVLLHPSSTWSAQDHEHWPFWRELAACLLSETRHTYLLTGLNAWPGIEHPRLVNLIGELPSNIELLALAGLCDGTVSTCNNLALWTALGKKPGFVVGNAAIREKENFFHRWIDRAPNTYLPVDTGFPEVRKAALWWVRKL